MPPLLSTKMLVLLLALTLNSWSLSAWHDHESGQTHHISDCQTFVQGKNLTGSLSTQTMSFVIVAATSTTYTKITRATIKTETVFYLGRAPPHIS